MKISALLFIICSLSYITRVNGQDANSSKYEEFYSFASKGFNPPDSVKKSCDWHYALVEIKTDQTNRIISYKLLNRTGVGLKNYFYYLIGYRFSPKITINKHPVVFCISIDNDKTSCSLTRRQFSPSEVLGGFFANLEPLLESDPKAIILPRILIVQYLSDSIR